MDRTDLTFGLGGEGIVGEVEPKGKEKSFGEILLDLFDRLNNVLKETGKFLLPYDRFSDTDLADVKAVLKDLFGSRMPNLTVELGEASNCDDFFSALMTEVFRNRRWPQTIKTRALFAADEVPWMMLKQIGLMDAGEDISIAGGRLFLELFDRDGVTIQVLESVMGFMENLLLTSQGTALLASDVVERHEDAVAELKKRGIIYMRHGEYFFAGPLLWKNYGSVRDFILEGLVGRVTNKRATASLEVSAAL